MSDVTVEYGKTRSLVSVCVPMQIRRAARLPIYRAIPLKSCLAVRLIIRVCFGSDCGGRLLHCRRRINVADFRSRIAGAQFREEKDDCAEKYHYCESSKVFENVLSGFHA